MTTIATPTPILALTPCAVSCGRKVGRDGIALPPHTHLGICRPCALAMRDAFGLLAKVTA